MRILATIDAGDYQDTTEVFEKYSVRGIVMRDGCLAMQRSSEGEYKLPGGGSGDSRGDRTSRDTVLCRRAWGDYGKAKGFVRESQKIYLSFAVLFLQGRRRTGCADFDRE